ncbi:MAG: endolytic transglycosylase MltG [Ignavibacteria bacterium]|nr:endolytic transglycosylase MltG [Ignavibacteria bacterium]
MPRNILYPSVFIFTFAVFFTLHFGFMSKSFRPAGDDAVIKITKGDNLRSVASKLEENRIIFNKIVFIAIGRLMGYQDNLIPGEYRFGNGLTYLNVLNTITDPSIIRTVTVTIPEGLNIRQMGRLLQRQIGIDSARFVEEAKNDSLVKLLGIDAKDLEGYLFPDTYQFRFTGMNREKEIVSVMSAEFRKKITPEIREEMSKRNISLRELIAMASIIEGETKFEPEKKTISGVYYNRIKKGMKLQADPTVQYILPGGPKNRLMYSDLKIESPYNTYLYKGLPPGPINNPGLSSIMAALHPEENKLLYFVAKGDGTHRFAESYDEHKKNIELYQKFLKELEEKKKNEKPGEQK